MPITVAELVATPYLGTRLHAGAGGARRRIRWAHSCEVPTPWAWLDEGDLLMTNGFSIPADAAGQVEFLRNLAEPGLSGLAIGDGQQAPRLTPEMIDAAEEYGFPILFTAYEVPFVALSRVVADANRHEEQSRLARTVRLYDRLREWTVDETDAASLLARLADEVRCRLHVLDADRGTAVLPGQKPPPGDVAEAVMREVAGRGSALPALTRVDAGAATVLVVPVPSRRPAILVATPRTGARPDLALLQHVATIAALQVERVTAEREHSRRLGSELLAHLIDGMLEAGQAAQRLDAHGLGGQALVMVACGVESDVPDRALHHGLTERAVDHLLLPRESCLLVLVQDRPAAIAALAEQLDATVLLGVSDPFQVASRVPDAAREAQWALEAAPASGERVVRYGENGPLFLPRTLGQADAAVSRVLGRLLDYDEAHGTQLVESLRVFLVCNRSWQRAASALFVHKQTLVYRIRRVEELSGRRLDSTADVAELWLALQARDLRLDVPGRTPGAASPGA